MRMVLVNPEPCFQPVTTITESPFWMNPRLLPWLMPYCTRTSTSFSQSSWAASEMSIQRDYCQGLLTSVHYN